MSRNAGRTRFPAVGVPPLLVLVGVVAAWQFVAVVVAGDRTYLMPTPAAVLQRGLLEPRVAGEILVALASTAAVALTGLAVAILIGVGWAVLMSLARWIERSTYPYAVILQSIPVLALVPLIGVWFGYDFLARTVVCVMVALFPIVSNAYFGLRGVDAAHHDLFTLQRAGRLTRLWKLELPAALPAIFAGMRISAGLAVVGAIVADFYFQRGTPGIGALIMSYQSRLQTPELFAAIIAAALFGVLVFLAFGQLARWAVGRWHEFA